MSTSPSSGSHGSAQVRLAGEWGETLTTAAPGSHLVQESLAELLHGSLELVSLGLPLLIVPDVLGRGALPRGGPGVVVHVVISASRIHTFLPPGNTRGRCHCPQTARRVLLAGASSCRVATRYKCWCEGSRKKPWRGREAQQKAQTMVLHRGTSHCPPLRAVPRALDTQLWLENIQLLPQNTLKA